MIDLGMVYPGIWLIQVNDDKPMLIENNDDSLMVSIFTVLTLGGNAGARFNLSNVQVIEYDLQKRHLKVNV